MEVLLKQKKKNRKICSIKELIETFETKDNQYIIMELCLINLEEYIKIKNEGLSIEEIKEILYQINNIKEYGR